MENPNRTCSTCACLRVIKKPAIMPPHMKKADFDAMTDQSVCRWFPPAIPVQFGNRQAMIQTPIGVPDDTVCWQWRAQGTLPGDEKPALIVYSIPGAGPVSGAGL